MYMPIQKCVRVGQREGRRVGHPNDKNAATLGYATGSAAGEVMGGATGSAAGGAAGDAKASAGDMAINNRAAASTVGSAVAIAGEALSFLAAAVSAQTDWCNAIGVVVLLFDGMGLRASCNLRRNEGFERAARSALS